MYVEYEDDCPTKFRCCGNCKYWSLEEHGKCEYCQYHTEEDEMCDHWLNVND